MVLFVRIGARTFRRTEKMKITPAIKNKVLQLRGEGTSYGNIAKATKISKASVINIIKARQQQSEVTEGTIRQSNENPLLPRGTVEAKILKPCVNPRLIMIYFGEPENIAKCVVKPGMNYRRDKTIKVQRVEFNEETIYRLV